MNRRAYSKFGQNAFILGLSLTCGALFLSTENTTSQAALVPVKKSVEFQPKFKNWGLYNTVSNSHISIEDAWKIEEGSSTVVVAVIDTGVDTTHEDLRSNIWSDPNPQNFNIIGNDISVSKRPLALISNQKSFGWDFVTSRPNPVDEHGHGTHVAGIIGAALNVKAGVSGVAHKVSLMPIRYYSDANPGPINLKNTISAIHYAIDRGARIINYSGGGPEYSRDEYLALKKAEARGILVVAAAGNERKDTDLPENYYYPAAYGLSNIISVAAIDIRNKVLESSNWGRKKVDIAAPGENIYSTLPGNRYGYMSGTSQATAFVTGVAALILAKNPSLSASDVKRIVLDNVDLVSTLSTKVATGGKINAYKALASLTTVIRPLPLAKPENLTRKPVSISVDRRIKPVKANLKAIQ